jgi:hypothetical protein
MTTRPLAVSLNPQAIRNVVAANVDATYFELESEKGHSAGTAEEKKARFPGLFFLERCAARAARAQDSIARMLPAFGPLGPLSTSNSTRWASFRDL